MGSREVYLHSHKPASRLAVLNLPVPVSTGCTAFGRALGQMGSITRFPLSWLIYPLLFIHASIGAHVIDTAFIQAGQALSLTGLQGTSNQLGG